MVEKREVPVYEHWTKKLDSRHLYRRGDSETLCGKPMLGNNYTHDIKERGYCEKCQEIWNKETGLLGTPYLQRVTRFKIPNDMCRFNDGSHGCTEGEEIHTCCEEECPRRITIFME